MKLTPSRLPHIYTSLVPLKSHGVCTKIYISMYETLTASRKHKYKLNKELFKKKKKTIVEWTQIETYYFFFVIYIFVFTLCRKIYKHKNIHYIRHISIM